jgi:hypothetical protein
MIKIYDQVGGLGRWQSAREDIELLILYTFAPWAFVYSFIVSWDPSDEYKVYGF